MVVGGTKKLIIRWTNPNGSQQNALVVATLSTDILRGGSETLVVPPGKRWIIVDVVRGENVTVGGRVELLVDDEPIAITDDVRRYDPANPSRPRDLAGFYVRGQHTIKANVYVNANNTGADVTEELILYIEEEDDYFPF